MKDPRVNPDGSADDRESPWWTTPLVGGVVIILLVAGVAAIIALKNRYDIAEQAKGRKVAITAICGVNQAIIEQGQKLIIGSVLIPGRTLRDSDRIMGVAPSEMLNFLANAPIDQVVAKYVQGRFSKNLESMGGRTFKQRLIGARLAADQYEAEVARRVANAARDRDLLTPPPEGLDCSKLLELSNASA